MTFFEVRRTTSAHSYASEKGFPFPKGTSNCFLTRLSLFDGNPLRVRHLLEKEEERFRRLSATKKALLIEGISLFATSFGGYNNLPWSLWKFPTLLTSAPSKEKERNCETKVISYSPRIWKRRRIKKWTELVILKDQPSQRGLWKRIKSCLNKA